MIYIFRAFIRNHTDWFWPFVIWLTGAVFLITVMCVWEGRTIFESVYYCIVTASSTGFGDITPLTVVGRVCTIIYILTAITAMAVFINAIIARGKVINKKKNRLKVCCWWGVVVRGVRAVVGVRAPLRSKMHSS